MVQISSCANDPLVHHGRHFGRTVHVMCNIQALITNGILRMGDDIDTPEESLTSECVLCFLTFIFWLIAPDVALQLTPSVV